MEVRQWFQLWPLHVVYGISRGAGAVMPIITPAYPCMNSAANVSPWTLQVVEGGRSAEGG